IRQVAEGLHYLHKTGFVHGDIKCVRFLVMQENVLVDPDGNAVIADFGLSTPVYSEDAPTATFIRERKTVKFSAPELFVDEAVDYGITLRVRSKTRMSDVYAFGALIYQVYSGSPPWHGLNDRGVLLRVCRGERPDRPPHPHLMDEIWDLCRRCWKHIPGDRPFMFFVLLELTAVRPSTRMRGRHLTLSLSLWTSQKNSQH
ncbi:kinase-like protein, partial [Exidia glandulosa HHB12029]